MKAPQPQMKPAALLLVFLFLVTAVPAQTIKRFSCQFPSRTGALSLTFSADKSSFSGRCYVRHLASGKEEQISLFGGVMNQQALEVNFKKPPPRIYPSLRWTARPWQLITVDNIDTIQIKFLEKNRQNNQWEEVVYEFIEEFDFP